MKYAYGTVNNGEITVSISINSSGFTITLFDTGKGFNPLNQKMPDLIEHKKEKKQGGLGIYLMKKTMDELEYKYNSGNHFRMIKYFPGIQQK